MPLSGTHSVAFRDRLIGAAPRLRGAAFPGRRAPFDVTPVSFRHDPGLSRSSDD
jgi:hypothetical protein